MVMDLETRLLTYGTGICLIARQHERKRGVGRDGSGDLSGEERYKEQADWECKEWGYCFRGDEKTFKEQDGSDWWRFFSGVGDGTEPSSEKPCKEEDETESRNEDVEKDEKGRSETCDKVDEASKMLEQVEIESRKSTLGEDGEAENLQDKVEEEGVCKSNEAVIETSDGGCEEEGKAEQGSRNEKKVDLEKMTLGDWFEYMKVHLRKQMVDETDDDDRGYEK
ncbi:hypothetical protein F2Q70_00024112 [Brassica cretica]|uniref:Uncharacterized protein n=1 Tax=Brassica cretica TaxID=69181 RepID=A0A8S9GPS9_BRACR|nr:hypothetical protein F2Q70_00024112 [Brassica cretica]